MKKIIIMLFAVSMLFMSGCSKKDENVVNEPVTTPVTEKAETPLTQKNKLNKEAVLWLKIEGCEIDNVVFHAKDNDKYLRLDENGEGNIWGCYFLDFINEIEDGKFTDKVNIIYGHAKDDDPNNKKFSKLKRFKDEEFAKENSVFSLEFLEGDSKWEVFAAVDMPITIDYIDPIPSDEKYQETLNYMLEHSYVDFGVDVSVDDQILLLSTCTSDSEVRFVIAAKEVK